MPEALISRERLKAAMSCCVKPQPPKVLKKRPTMPGMKHAEKTAAGVMGGAGAAAGALAGPAAAHATRGIGQAAQGIGQAAKSGLGQAGSIAGGMFRGAPKPAGGPPAASQLGSVLRAAPQPPAPPPAPAAAPAAPPQVPPAATPTPPPPPQPDPTLQAGPPGDQPLMEAGQPAGPISLDDPGNFASSLAETAGEPPPPPEIALDPSIGGQASPGPVGSMPPIEELMRPVGPAGSVRAKRRLMGSAPAGKTEMAMKGAAAREKNAVMDAVLGALLGTESEMTPERRRNLPQSKAAAIRPPKPATRSRERFKMRLRLPLPQEPEKFAAALAGE